MKYLYYPGCSLEGTATEYDYSTRALMQALGVELTEITDWTCCGASAAEAVDHMLALALPARNLALAEHGDGNPDIMVPCSACYLNLKKVEQKTRREPELLKKINDILLADGLRIKGSTRVRHLLDILARDLTAESIRKARARDLSGLTIAPYYGCQCLRPYPVFDDPETPNSMEPLIEATGASVFQWHMGARCCGAAHMNTKLEVGMELVAAILRDAQGCDAMVTVCPMCQMNLEGFQNQISRRFNENFDLTILYLPQLLGLALGIPERDLGLHLNLSVSSVFKKKLSANQPTQQNRPNRQNHAKTNHTI